MISAANLRRDLAELRPAEALVAAEGGGWSAVLPGLPVHGDGETFADAIDDLILALREYSEDSNARLYRAPNHRGNRAVVGLVELSDDEQLRDWILAGTNGDAEDRPALANA